MSGCLNIFQAETGDCMALSFLGNDKKMHHLIIDAGFADTFENTLSPFLEEVQDKGEAVDLFIITHIDKDHISGMQEFVFEFGHEENLVKNFLFNHSPKPFPIFKSKGERNIGVADGINLREYLKENGKLNEEPITVPYSRNIGGAKLTLLSPTKKKYARHLKDWEKWGEKEKSIEKWVQKEQLIGSSKNDYDQSISDLIKEIKNSKHKSDTSSNNGSSIAFVFELNGFRILFTGDAHPSVLASSLKEQFNCSKTQKLKIDYVQLPHHGSKRNTNLKFLELIDCSNFFVSTDGYSHHNHPHKETFARIIYQRQVEQDEKKKNVPLKFLFNHENYILEKIFSDQEKKDYNLQLTFPQDEYSLAIRWN